MKILATGSNPTNITTTPPALAVNTCPTNAKSFELQGRSLVLNQLTANGNFSDKGYWSTNSGSFTVANNIATFTASAYTGMLYHNDIAIQANHKYAVLVNVKLTTATTAIRLQLRDTTNNVTLGDASSIATTDWQRLSFIVTTTAAVNVRPRIVDFRASGWDAVQIKEVMLIDLTQMFNAGFEPTTVDQVQSIIDLSKYIPFNPGTFIHNNATYEVNKWNQLVNLTNASGTIGGVPYTINNGRVTFNGTCSVSNNLVLQNINIVSNHKYLLTNYPQKMPISALAYNTLQLYAQNIINIYITENDIVNDRIATASGSGIAELRARIENGQTYSTSFCPQVIDLTDIFGAGKEPSTVDECKLRFLAMGIDITKYQPYSPIDGQYCGYRNIWDEQWEVGSITSDGFYASNTDTIRSKNFTPVLPNASYYINKSFRAVYYDINKNFLYRETNPVNQFATPSNCYYIKITGTTTYGPVYKNDISIYQVSNKVDLGFNIWDEEVESGYIDPNGALQPHSTSLRSKNYCTCMAGTIYYAKQPTSFANATAIAWYKSDKTFLSRNFVSNKTVTAPTDAMFFKVSLYNYGTTYNHDICINLSQSDTTKSPHNGDYRPYLMLRGIGSDFNVWDETIESGEYNATTGEKQASVDYLRCVNKTRILPSTTYYLKSPLAVSAYYYDVDGVKIGTNSPTLSANSTFTTIAGAYYMTFAFNKNNYGSTTYKSDICINLSQPQTTINPHNGQYVPHLFDTYDSMSGILTRRIGAVDLGTLNWQMIDTNIFCLTYSSLIQNLKSAGGCVCTKYAGMYPSGNPTSWSDKTVALSSWYNYHDIVIKDSSYSDATTFKAAMNGVMLLYEFATSTVETTITQPISFVSGKLGKQYGVVDLGSLSWMYDPDEGDKFFFSDELSTMQQDTPNVLCAAYRTNNSPTFAGRLGHMEMKVFGLRVYLKNTLYTNATAFKNTLQGQYLIYELADGATGMTYATAGNLIQKTKGDVGDVDFNLKYWENSQVKLLKAGNKYLAVNE